MNLARWLQFGTLLVVAFLMSVGVGAWVGRQRSVPPVSSVATPTPAVSAAVTPSLAPPTATSAPSPSPPPASAPPTTPPTVPPTAPVTPEPTVAVDPPTVEEFAAALLAAFRTGDSEYLFDRLHPVVFDRYGEGQCRTHVDTFEADPDAQWTVVSSAGPAPWAWETDNLATTIEDTWTVKIDEPGTGQRELHFAPSDAQWRWFLDCGDPV